MGDRVADGGGEVHRCTRLGSAQRDRRKRAEGKKHNVAVICVARRHCDLILAMLKTGTPYQPPNTENLLEAA